MPLTYDRYSNHIWGHIVVFKLDENDKPRALGWVYRYIRTKEVEFPEIKREPGCSARLEIAKKESFVIAELCGNKYVLSGFLGKGEDKDPYVILPRDSKLPHDLKNPRGS